MSYSRIRISWYSTVSQRYGHGKYMTYDEFISLTGETPEEFLEKLNARYPELHHSVEVEPYIAL